MDKEETKEEKEEMETQDKPNLQPPPFIPFHDRASRPSTAASLIQRLNLERHNEADGFSVSGLFFSTHCYVIVLLMAAMLLIIGLFLLIVVEIPHAEDISQHELQEIEGQARFWGPISVGLGLFLSFLGLVLCVISCKSKNESTNDQNGKQFMPLIAQGLPFGIVATPAIPAVVSSSKHNVDDIFVISNRYRPTLKSASLQVSPFLDTRPATADAEAHPHHQRRRRQSLPHVERALSVEDEVGALRPAAAGPYCVRRGSTRHAALLNEARHKLSELNRNEGSLLAAPCMEPLPEIQITAAITATSNTAASRRVTFNSAQEQNHNDEK